MANKKYLVDASVSICVENVPVNMDFELMGSLEEELRDALNGVLEKRLALLDIKGGRSGDDGCMSQMLVEQIDRWEIKD